MLPLFKKTHIHSQHIEDFLKSGIIAVEYQHDNNKRNALRQASLLYRIVNGELFRFGSEREYQKYGLRMVVHDDQPEKKAEIIAKCHIDSMGNHVGMNNTIKNVVDTYYWQGISAHVKMYLKQCEQCKARSKFNADEWLKLERENIDKKKLSAQVSSEAQIELRNLGRVKKPSPPETFFIVNAESKVNLESADSDASMMIDSNNIEYVVETLGQSDGLDLEEVCHVLNVPDIVPIPERFRSREIETFIRDGTFPADFTSNMKCGLKGPAGQYRIIDEELYHEGNKAGSKGLRFVIHDDLPALKVKVMVECHIDEDGAHHGLNKTLTRIGEKYYWTGMSVDVRKFMMHCKICSEQRGKRTVHDGKQYEEEAQKVKLRHMKKMKDQSDSDDILTAVPVSYNSADIEPTNGLEQEGHQVIRLIGPNKEITEITVAVVNQETVTAENSEHTVQEEDSNGGFSIVAGAVTKGQSIVTKEMTDAVAQIEAAEAAMEMDDLRKQNNVKTEEQEDGVKNFENKEGSEEAVDVKHEYTEMKEDDTEVETIHTEEVAEITETVEEEMTQIEGEMTQVETDDGVVNVLIIKDGEEENGGNAEEEAETGSIVDLMPGEEQMLKEVARQNDSSIVNEPRSFYQEVIYVPSIMKTRIIENFLKVGEGAEGFSHTRLLDMSANFEIVDDVLYRRPSRYKGRQIVIHDDCPELKLKLIEDLHLKRNGTHCSDLITHQNVAFKYFWEEMKWDIHRWYPTCNICVNDNGIERRSKKKILTVEEQKRLLEGKRRENRMSGASALKSREFRNRSKNNIYKINLSEGFGKGQGQPGLFHLSDARIEKGMGSREDSDIEIITTGSEGSGKTPAVQVKRKRTWNVLYDLLIYATLDQEQCIKEMYADKGWKYNLMSFVKAPNEENLDDDDDYYLLTMKVTSIQENAIKDLFQTMGLVIEASNDTTQIAKSLSGKPVQTQLPNTKAPVPQKLETIQKEFNDPEGKTTDGSTAQKKQKLVVTAEPEMEIDNENVKDGEVTKTQKSSKEPEKQSTAQATVIPVLLVENMRSPDKEQPSTSTAVVKAARKTHIIESPVAPKVRKIASPVAHIRKISIESSVASKPEVNLSPKSPASRKITCVESSVSKPTRKAAETEQAESPATRKADIKVTKNIVESHVKAINRLTTNRQTEKDESLAPPTVDKTATKRKIIETPVSESRRSKREIKRPRRFSPDSSPPRFVTLNTEPESQNSDSQAEEDEDVVDELETPRKGRTKGKGMVKSAKIISLTTISVQETSKEGNVRANRSSQITPKLKTPRNLRPSGEQQIERNIEDITETEKSEISQVVTEKNQSGKEMTETNITGKGKETVMAKVSIMSKGRIRVKKVPKESNNSVVLEQAETSQENLDGSKKDNETVGKITKDVQKSIENIQNNQEEEDKNFEMDDLDDDSDDDDEEDYYDDDDEIDEESEDMKIPLEVLLDDNIERMEAVEAEKGFVCSICNAKFPNKSKCIHHGKRNNCYDECELCGKIYKKKDQTDIEKHAELHKEGKKFTCVICKKVFFNDEHLKIHVRSHQKERFTSCSQCKEKFHTWFQYASHMVNKHEECNMFTCDVCNAKFASINFMKSEIKFDGKLSYFRCVMCDN